MHAAGRGATSEDRSHAREAPTGKRAGSALLPGGHMEGPPGARLDAVSVRFGPAPNVQGERNMSRFTAPLTLAIFALAVPILALLALANGETDWEDGEAGESCSLS